MLTGRKALVLVVILLVPSLGGCLVGAVAGGGSAYVLTSQQQTALGTDIFNLGGDEYVEDAVKTWLARGQLPLPVLPDGTHTFGVRRGEGVKVKHSRGARVVTLYDGGRPIATYVIAWDRRPLEYRVHKATNLLYAGELDASTAPVIRITDLYMEK